MYDEEIAFRVENIKRSVNSAFGFELHRDNPDAMARIVAAVMQADAIGKLTDAISQSATELSTAIGYLAPD